MQRVTRHQLLFLPLLLEHVPKIGMSNANVLVPVLWLRLRLPARRDTKHIGLFGR